MKACAPSNSEWCHALLGCIEDLEDNLQSELKYFFLEVSVGTLIQFSKQCRIRKVVQMKPPEFSNQDESAMGATTTTLLLDMDLFNRLLLPPASTHSWTTKAKAPNGRLWTPMPLYRTMTTLWRMSRSTMPNST
jgi:hypothetical protein